MTDAGGVLLDFPLLSVDDDSFLLAEEPPFSDDVLPAADAAGAGSAPIWLHVCARSARGLRLASSCKSNSKQSIKLDSWNIYF